MNMNARIALVTGASTGIGQASAERIAKAGHKVYGASRLRGHAGGGVRARGSRWRRRVPLTISSRGAGGTTGSGPRGRQ